MWKVAARSIVLASGLWLAACLPNLPSFVSPAAVNVTASVETTPTIAVLVTEMPTMSLVPAPTILVSAAGAFTAIPTFTSTNGAEASAVSSITPAPSVPSATATILESVSLDKLPPGTVYKSVRIENRSRSQMDISLHCTTLRGLQTVLEYGGVKNLTVQAPEGRYVYVVYVGGRQLVGSFELLAAPSLTITVYADRVAIH
jgi:hypothetical protein